MNYCAKCGHKSVTKAHVKDKEICLSEGIKKHEILNIVELCYNCHYTLFDKGKMGIKLESDGYYFLWLNENNDVEKSKSLFDLNIHRENIKWKNRKCSPKLIRQLFKK